MSLIDAPRPDNLVLSPAKTSGLADQMKRGLDAPICLTWELTYACNLQCVHCLSSSGRRDPRELTTAEWQELFARNSLRVETVLPDQWPRQRWWHLLPGKRPRPGRPEWVARSLFPVRWCNELIFVLRRADHVSD